MLVVGLTGGIGSGKTQVAAFFAKRGVPIIDADHIAREIVEPGQPALAEIAHAFGTAALDGTGRLDRAALRKVVFNDEAQRQKLEAILHPLVRASIRNRLATLQAPYCIVAIPLLLETGQRDLIDRILVVDTPLETQIQRAQQRDGVSRAEIEAVLRAQLPREQRLAQADDIILNDASLGILEEKVQKLHENYLTLTNADM